MERNKMIEYLSDQNLEDALTNELTIVDFFATWCGPCKMLGMEMEELKNIKILKVDVDEHQELAQKHGIMSVPTVEIYQNKKMVTSFIGYKTKDEIEQILKKI
jgi:thioredoxin 1